jgi:hypothetical protein
LVELVQVADSELQDVCLLQLGYIFPLSLQGHCHDVLQLVKTLVDTGPPFPFQEWLGDLLVLVCPGERNI